ncbi:MAG TPA: GNAT family N-acetyltransferase [Candidatus Bathyarchaeia archaeon]|nr:GNAT family N-acetyltransferase [Candidatus Bathyarchaeia archaeon]
MPVAIERLGESPTSALGALVAESEAHGLHFVRRLLDEWTAAAEVGRVRHLYVLIGHRQAGVGRQLVERVIEVARGHFACLRLRTGNPAAARLYESLGFRASADLASATHVLDLA